MKRVKIVMKNNTRKYEIPEENCHVHVKKLIEQTTKTCGFIPVLQYRDEERDWITIGTEADLALCLQTCVTPKIYIFTPGDAIENRDKASKDAKEPTGWVKYGFDRADSESPELIAKPNEAEAQKQQPIVPPAPMQVDDENKDEKEAMEATPAPDPNASAAGAASALPFDWNTLVEDFLTNQRALSALISEVYDAVDKGSDIKSATLKALDKEPLKSHPFVVNALPDLEKMLGKVNHMSVLLLQAGKNGVELAVPLLARGFAKMKMGSGGVVDVAPAFMQAFPSMTNWLRSGLGNKQEATFDLGKVLRHMVKPRGGEADGPGEPDADIIPGLNDEPEDPEVAAAAKDGIVLHKGITCDVCDERPIIGVRYKCMVCKDFDMCEECKNKGTHPAEHPLIQMNKPAPRGGFSVSGGHYKGAQEMLKWKRDHKEWKGCGGKWPGMKRRAMKKMFRGMHKDGEGAPHRGGGRHGHRRRHHPFAPPHPQPPAHNPFAPPAPPARQDHTEQTRYGMPGMTAGYGGYGSDSSSSSSSSSDSDTPQHPGRGKRHSRKKGKKFMKRLSKRRNKISKKIAKTQAKQRKLGRRLHRLHEKESKLNRILQEEELKMQHQAPPNANQPGTDPNPNRGPRRPPMGPFPWGFQGHPHWGMAGPWARGPHQMPQGPPAPPAPASNTEEYALQLQHLTEMGFTDVATCKRLLKETKGDIKSVIVMMSLSKNGQNFGKQE